VLFFYSKYYDLRWDAHIFPCEKYRLVRTRLLQSGVADGGDFVEPEPADDADILLVHTKAYLQRLYDYTRSPMSAIFELEAPLFYETLSAFFRMTGGTVEAARRAILQRSFWANIGGGFHHAFPDHGEGFCAINDVAVAIRVLQKEGLIKRAAVVDCDLHQGNGTAFIFQHDPSVFTFSIHQENLYPPKQRSDLDIGLDDFTGDDVYLEKLRAGLERVFEEGGYDIVFYLAGADPYKGDKLGTLRLSKEGLLERDRMVFEASRMYGASVCVVLAGGYADRTEDVVEIHTNTLTLMKEMRGHSSPLLGV